MRNKRTDGKTDGYVEREVWEGRKKKEDPRGTLRSSAGVAPVLPRMPYGGVSTPPSSSPQRTAAVGVTVINFCSIIKISRERMPGI